MNYEWEVTPYREIVEIVGNVDKNRTSFELDSFCRI